MAPCIPTPHTDVEIVVIPQHLDPGPMPRCGLQCVTARQHERKVWDICRTMTYMSSWYCILKCGARKPVPLSPSPSQVPRCPGNPHSRAQRTSIRLTARSTGKARCNIVVVHRVKFTHASIGTHLPTFRRGMAARCPQEPFASREREGAVGQIWMRTSRIRKGVPGSRGLHGWGVDGVIICMGLHGFAHDLTCGPRNPGGVERWGKASCPWPPQPHGWKHGLPSRLLPLMAGCVGLQ